ncbi:hypothetical protein D9M71_173080 [compost metagenome]
MGRDDVFYSRAVLGLLQGQRIDEDVLVRHAVHHALQLSQCLVGTGQLLQDRAGLQLGGNG